MNFRNLSPFACLVLLSQTAVAQSPWDIAAWKNQTVSAQWGPTRDGIQEVHYTGPKYQGKPTRIFAYYAKPEGKGPYPAVLLVHGGGGKAFSDWALHWARRGYCALAMDLAGKGPKERLPDGGPDQTDEIKFQAFAAEQPENTWVHQAVGAVILGHNLLLSLPEVDSDRIGVTGISWGGFLTCLIASNDDRIKVAVPVYGCGFLHENSYWKPARFDAVEANRRNLWVKFFDPSSHLSKVGCPILFLNGTNDFAYPLDSYLKSYQLVKSPKNLSVRVRLPHGHIWTFPEVDAFIDAHLKGGQPLCKVERVTDGRATQAAAKVVGPVPVKEVLLAYAKAEGPWDKREWKTVPAKKEKDLWQVELPRERPLVHYFLAVDERGLQTSCPHQIEP